MLAVILYHGCRLHGLCVAGAQRVLRDAMSHIRSRRAPFALLVKKNCFGPYEFRPPVSPYSLTREAAIRVLLREVGERDPIVSTTGFASREVFELREELGQDHSRDFLTVGSMGHASAIAMGIAIARPSRSVVCLDGDGALAMHMGNALTIGLRGPANLLHVLLNNGVHDSVGGQDTGMYGVDFEKVAYGLGYSNYSRAETADEIIAGYRTCKAQTNGPSFLEVRVKAGARDNLGRPTTTPQQNRDAFMRFLQN